MTGEEYLLDTICNISIYNMKDSEGMVQPAGDMSDEAEAVIETAFDLCRSLEGELSRTKEDSDIEMLNSAGGEWKNISYDAGRVIEKGLWYSEMSGGDFDITVGGLSELWDFHAAEGEGKLPGADALAEAARHVGYKNVEIDYEYEEGGVDDSRVRLKDPETKIDLGGIAKGYIGDRMAEVLLDAGASSAIINLGGNVICIGGRTDSDDFVIGVEAPFSDRTDIIGKINVRDKTLVTSGVYERKMEIEGKLYHHILDVKTGWPAETDLDAVTLIAERGMSCDIDALSTICLIKGYTEARKLIEDNDGIEAVFVLSDGSIEMTAGANLQ